MDLDKALVSALLQAGPDGLKDVQDEGVGSDLLQDDGKRAYDFLLDFYQQYSSFPSPDVVEGHLGISLEAPPQEPVAFFAQAIVNRQLYTRLSKTYQDGVKHLELNDPRAALAETQRAMYEIDRERLTNSRVIPMPSLGKDVIEFYRKIKAGERGVLTPWSSLNEATFGFWPEDLILFVARTGVGKCLVFQSILIDPKTGVERTIEDVYKDPSVGLTTTWSKEDGIHVRKIAAKHDTGYKTCLKFSLGTGRSVSVTPEHPFLTPDGWRRADELKPGHTVGLPARMPLPLEPVDLPRHEVDLLAIMLADGACTSKTPRFTKQDPDIVALGEGVAAALGISLVATDEGRDHSLSGQGCFCPGGNPAKVLLIKHGLDGVKSKDKVIPEAIFRLPKESLARFLAVFWMCDGYEERGTACVTLASEKMVRQLQHLFLRFGIQSSVSYKKAKCQTGEFDAWVLRIYSQCVETFLKEIPAFGTKMARLKASSCTDGGNANVGFPRVSEDLMLQIKAEAGEQKGRWTSPERTAAKRRVADRLGRKEFAPRDLFKQHGDTYSVALDALRVYAEEFGCLDKYQWLFDSEVFWDVVEDVEDIGEQKIYDLTVEPTSCFVADDVIVHNTWMALILAHYAWTQGHKVLFVTTEVGKLAMGIRWAALACQLSYQELRHGMLSAFDEDKLVQGIKDFEKIEGFDIVGGDFDFRIETLDIAIAEAKPDLVVADGATMFRSEGSNRTERAANTMDDMKRTAKRRAVPLVLTTQFNREVKSGSKATSMGLEKIAQTDASGWNADQVYALYQTEEMRSDKRMGFKPMKIREGFADDWEVTWDLDRMDFTEIPKTGGSTSDAAEDDYDTGVGSGAPPLGDTEDAPF